MTAIMNANPFLSTHMGSFIVVVEVSSGMQVKPFVPSLKVFISQVITAAFLAIAAGAADSAFLMISSSLAAIADETPANPVARRDDSKN
jgi:hypothetical protein